MGGRDFRRNSGPFSAFRLPGRPTGWEWEVLSRPLLPGAFFEEFFSRSYGIVNLTYQYEALFFVYPYLRGTWAWIDRPRFKDDGRVGNQMDDLSALGAGVAAGAPWRSQVEINYSYNFGILRDTDGQPEFGGHSVIIHWSKEF